MVSDLIEQFLNKPSTTNQKVSLARVISHYCTRCRLQYDDLKSFFLSQFHRTAFIIRPQVPRSPPVQVAWIHFKT